MVTEAEGLFAFFRHNIGYINYKSPHLLAGIVFLTLSILSLGSFLAGDSLFLYRDLAWPRDIDAYIALTNSTLDLDLTRRSIYLEPFLVITSFLGLSSLAAEKLFFLAVFSLTGFFAYWTVFKFINPTKRKADYNWLFLISAIAGFFYMYNPFSAQKIALMTTGFAFSYMLIPLVFYFFNRSLNEKSFKNIFLCSILISLAVAGTAQFLILLPIFILAPWFIVTILRKRLSKESISLPIRNMAYIAALFLLLSSYWIYPAVSISLSSQPPEPEYVLTDLMLKIFSSDTSILNSFRLMGAWWPYIELQPIGDESVWMKLTFVIPAMLVISLISAFRSEFKFYAIAIFGMILFVIFFFKGSQEPFGEFYLHLYTIPLVGWMFRVPDTNGIFLPFLFMMVIVLGLYTFLRLYNNGVMKLVRLAPLVILVSSISIVSWPMFTGDFGGIYKNDRPYVRPIDAAQIEPDKITVAEPDVVVVGGSEIFNSLNNTVTEYNPLLSLAYADKNLGSLAKLDHNHPTIIVTDERNDMGMHLLDNDSIIIKPFDATLKHDSEGRVWSRASTSDPLHGPFHPYLRSFGLENGDFDYGMGVVLTWGEDKLNIPIEVSKDGHYELLIRYMQNPKGGIINVDLHDQSIDINTKSDVTKFVWKDLGTFEISKGSYQIGLGNIEGFNVVNILVLVDSDSFQKIPDKVGTLLEKNRILYVLEAESSFYTIGNQTGEELLFRGINGTSTKTFTSTLWVPPPASQLSLEFWAKPSMNTNSSYKITNLEIIPSNNNNLLAVDFENNADLQLFVTDPNYIQLSLDKSNSLSDDNGLKANIVQSRKETWNVVRTIYIPANENTKLAYSMVLLANNTVDLHSKVIYYDEAKKAIGENYIFSNIPKTTNLISNSFTTPTGTRFITLQFWMKTNPNNVSSFFVDNVRIERTGTESSIKNKELFDAFENLKPNSQLMVRNDQSLEVFYESSDEQNWNVIKTRPIPVSPNSFYEFKISIESEDIESIYSLVKYSTKGTKVTTRNNLIDGSKILQLRSNVELVSDLFLPKDSFYTLAARIYACETCSSFSMQLGNTSESFSLEDNENGFKWFYLGEYLKAGNTKLKIIADDEISVDKVIIYSNSHETETLNDVFMLSTEPATLSNYEKVSLAHYEVKASAAEPFTLRFVEKYHPKWLASVNGQSYHSVELYPHINGFYISDTGDLDILIEYEPYRWFLVGIVITAITIVVPVGCLIWQRLKSGPLSRG